MGVEVTAWAWAWPSGNDNGPPAPLASNSDSSGGEFSLTHDIRPEDMLFWGRKEGVKLFVIAICKNAVLVQGKYLWWEFGLFPNIVHLWILHFLPRTHHSLAILTSCDTALMDLHYGGVLEEIKCHIAFAIKATTSTTGRKNSVCKMTE